MKLNCDMGESFGPWVMGKDEKLMPYIDMANIACGFHASDPQIMSQTVALALKHQVMIGAHPSYPDLQGFGRKPMRFSPAEIVNMVLYQVGALQAICSAHNTEVAYVKPHGALYNTMMNDEAVYIALLQAVSSLDNMPLMIMASENRQQWEEKAKQWNVTLLFEAFCDRAYTDDGNLQSRQIEGAVHHSIDKIEAQAQTLIVDQQVVTTSGKPLAINADSLCVHGDSELAVESVKRIRQLL